MVLNRMPLITDVSLLCFFLAISIRLLSPFSIRQKMIWTNQHDILLCREILVEEPYKFKHGSRERGQCWDRIANALSRIEKPRFMVDQRSVRDHFMKLEKNHKRKMAAEERASGIDPEHTELDEALQDIVERTEGAQDELAKGEERRERNAEKEKETAEDVRKRSMERLSQTRERESPESAKKKRKCSSPGDTVEYLKEKSERELEIRREEIELRKREMALKEREAEREWELKRKEQDLREREVEQRMRDQEARNEKDQDMVAILQQQLQQQQAMFQQMQQQNQILFELMKNTLEKK